MDVLEHIRDDYSALKEWKKVLNPNGIILISVPAFQHLWSHHDKFLGHYRRYNKKDFILNVNLQQTFWALSASTTKVLLVSNMPTNPSSRVPQSDESQSVMLEEEIFSLLRGYVTLVAKVMTLFLL